MTHSMIVSNHLTIDASPARVWEALVDPEQTRQYMFGCEALSDWQPGSPLVWKMMHEGKEFIPVKGSIVEIRPHHYLAYTVIDPHSGIEDKPENYLTVTYTLEEADGQTRLTVTQGDYAAVADGQKRYDEAMAAGGWSSILQAIKEMVEGHAGA